MILVFGKTGQVASELAALLPEAVFLGRAEADLTDPAACHAAILTAKPTAVINAAAYTAVDRAEEDEATATLVNGQAPSAMAKACAELGIPLVHISTDYVFDGQGRDPFSPDQATAPLGAYGRSKLLGEQGVIAAGGVHAIVRTSWVFSAHGANFVKTMLRLGATRDQLSIVADQTGGPTPARAVAQVCLAIATQLISEPSKSGTYHFTGAPDVSWSDFARAIFQSAAIDCVVQDIPTSAYPTPAARPANSRLSCETTLATFDLPRPSWAEALSETLTELDPQP